MSGADAAASATLGEVTDGDTTTGGGMADDESTTGASDSVTDSTGSDESGDTGMVCEGGQAQLTFTPETPNVVLVLDKSRSMSNLWDADANPDTAEISRWHSLHNVVSFLTAELGGQINFGAQLFPSADAYLDEPVNDYSCQVTNTPEVDVGPMTAPAILDAMPAADDFSISGGTPTVAGISNAIDHLEIVGNNAPRAIVLVTDGAANCNPNLPGDETLFVYDDRVPTIVESAFVNHGIPVYVVGINILDQMGTKPAINPYDALVEVALAGGVPNPGNEPFYNAFNELELADALAKTVDKIECTFALPEEPEYPQLLEIELDGVPYSEVSDCDAQDGWAYTSPNGPYNTVRLCGSACDALQGGGVVDVEFPCP